MEHDERMGCPECESGELGVSFGDDGESLEWQCDGCRATVSFVGGLRHNLRRARVSGIIEGMTRFAHWKDGVEYVGTCGTTLEKAIEEVRRETEGGRR